MNTQFINKQIIPFIKVYALKIIFIGVISIYIMLTGYALSKPMLFTQEDESIYILTSQSFALTNSIKANDFFDNKVSLLFECNWYGPFYQILFGSLMKLTTTHPIFFLWFNWIIFLSIILIILKIKSISINDRLKLIICILTFPVVFPYIFTCFPEIFNLLIAIVLSILLLRIYKNKKDERFYKYYLIFITIIFVAILFRITFVFWLSGLIPIGKSKKNFFLSLLIFFLGLIFTMLFKHYFNAPYLVSASLPIEKLMNGEINVIFYVFKTFYLNTVNFFGTNKIFTFSLFFLIIITLYQYYKTRNRIFISIILIVFFYFIVLFSFYTSYDLPFNKQILVLFPLMLIGVFLKSDDNSLKNVIILFGLVSYIFYFIHVFQAIRDRHTEYVEIKIEQKNFCEAY